MSTKELVPVRAISKSREVLTRLRDAIWSGDLAPGTPLREAHLARQLNVSQVPVREALLQLENLGLVVRVPDRGTTVTNLSRREIEQMREVRLQLEGMAFELAAKRITPEVEAELRNHLKRMEAFVADKDHRGAAEEDFRFHQTVWKASGNQVLESTLERLCIAVYAFVSLKRHAAGETMRTAVKSHRKLMDALLSRDPKKARRGVDEHLSLEAVIPPSLEE